MNSPGLIIQLSNVFLIAFYEQCANTVYHAPYSYHRVSRSVMAAEVHALFHAAYLEVITRETKRRLESRYGGLNS